MERRLVVSCGVKKTKIAAFVGAVVAVCFISLTLFLCYGPVFMIGLVQWDMRRKSSDEWLKARFAEHREEFLEFASRLMEEERVSEIVLAGKRQIRVALDDCSLELDERDLGKADLPLDLNDLRLYVDALRNTGFVYAARCETRRRKHRYIRFVAGGWLDVEYGLIFSPEDISPFDLDPDIDHSAKIENNWYTFRWEFGSARDD